MYSTLKNSWIFRYKLYHLPFWLLYHYLWLSYYEENLTIYTAFAFSPSLVKFLFYVIFQAFGVYFCLYLLIPKLLEKGHILLFLLSMLANIILVSIIITSGYFVAAGLFGYDANVLYFKDKPPFEAFKNSALPSTFSSMAIAMSIKLGKNWLESQQKRQLLEKKSWKQNSSF